METTIAWCKTRNWWPRFIRNYDRNYADGLFGFERLRGVEDFLTRVREADEITRFAFEWSASPEGYCYWERINKQITDYEDTKRN